MNVIGVGGQLGSGKDHLSNHLRIRLEDRTEQTWGRLGFADAVKKVYCDWFDVDLAFVEAWKRNADTPPGFDLNVRKSLQWIGDGFRQIKAEIWIDIALRGDFNRIISDVRYINEAKRIDRTHQGLNVALWRQGYDNNDPHPSEAQIAPIIRWFRDTGREGVVTPDWFVGQPQAPKGTEYFHLFLRNEAGVEEFEAKIDAIILPVALEKFGYVRAAA